MRRLRQEEEGIALAVAISVLTIVLILVGVAVAYSIHSLDRSNRDRASARALAAAQGGIDVARWRMNKSIIADQYAGIVGQSSLLSNAISTLGCAGVSVNVAGNGLIGLNVNGSDGWCPGTQEILEGTSTASSSNETYQYYATLNVGVDLDLTPQGDALGHLSSGLVTRKIVSIGRSGTQSARLLGVMKVDLNHLLESSNSLKLWTLGRVIQCPSSGFSASNPTAGCPSV